MKVILKSNFDYEDVADRLLHENVSEEDARRLADDWNAKNATDHGAYWCLVKADGYVLWRGMADLVGEEKP